MPPERVPHERTLMAWPPDVPQGIFTPRWLEPARDVYAEIARTIVAYEPGAALAAGGDSVHCITQQVPA